MVCAVMFFGSFNPGMKGIAVDAELISNVVDGTWFGFRVLSGFDREACGAFTEFFRVMLWHDWSGPSFLGLSPGVQ